MSRCMMPPEWLHAQRAAVHGQPTHNMHVSTLNDLATPAHVIRLCAVRINQT